METTKEKKCPKCKSDAVVDTGHKTVSTAKEFSSRKSIPEPTVPIFRCKTCEVRFKIK